MGRQRCGSGGGGAQAEIKQENLKHGDLLQGNLLDSYLSLTIMGIVDWLLHSVWLDITGGGMEKPEAPYQHKNEII